MEIILPTIFAILFGIGVFLYVTNKKRWKYIIRKDTKKLPNVDQGYWETTGPIGQKLRFTDDAIEIAHRRYLSNEGDRIEFIDSKFRTKK